MFLSECRGCAPSSLLVPGPWGAALCWSLMGQAGGTPGRSVVLSKRQGLPHILTHDPFLFPLQGTFRGCAELQCFWKEVRGAR